MRRIWPPPLGHYVLPRRISIPTWAGGVQRNCPLDALRAAPHLGVASAERREWVVFRGLHQDMRFWDAPQLADILVSELLGSFGDNELSPECSPCSC